MDQRKKDGNEFLSLEVLSEMELGKVSGGVEVEGLTSKCWGRTNGCWDFNIGGYTVTVGVKCQNPTKPTPTLSL